jgi:hypothetical protein
MKMPAAPIAKPLLALLIAGVSAACGSAGVANQSIQRISSTSGGNTFAYFRPSIVDNTCNANIPGGSGIASFSVFTVPTKEMLAILLSAQASGKPIPFMYVSTGNTALYLPGYGNVGSCKIESLDISD